MRAYVASSLRVLPRYVSVVSKCGPSRAEHATQEIDYDMSYVDSVSISISTSVLFNYPFSSFARLPVSLTISLSLFASSVSGCRISHSCLAAHSPIPGPSYSSTSPLPPSNNHVHPPRPPFRLHPRHQNDFPYGEPCEARGCAKSSRVDSASGMDVLATFRLCM